MPNLELNIPSNLQRGDYISCRIDNEVVSGEVFISPKDVAVRLTAEGMGLQASVHIMLMQPSTYTQGDSPYIANERAVSRIQALMIGLAQDYIIVQRNKNKILNRLPQYRDALFVHEDTLADLSQEKISARRQLRQGLISQSDYIRILDGIRTREFVCQHELKSQFHKIFDDILSECTHCDNLIEIVLGLDQ
jgi:hypothetical protein